MDVKFEGMGVLLEQVNKMGAKADEASKEALISAGELLQADTKKRAPVLTGNLRDHVKVSEVEKGSINVYVDSQGKAYYGYMIEVGTSKMSAQPFMYPAFMANQDNIEKKMIEVLRARLGLV